MAVATCPGFVAWTGGPLGHVGPDRGSPRRAVGWGRGEGYGIVPAAAPTTPAAATPADPAAGRRRPARRHGRGAAEVQLHRGLDGRPMVWRSTGAGAVQAISPVLCCPPDPSRVGRQEEELPGERGGPRLRATSPGSVSSCSAVCRCPRRSTPEYSLSGAPRGACRRGGPGRRRPGHCRVDRRPCGCGRAGGPVLEVGARDRTALRAEGVGFPTWRAMLLPPGIEAAPPAPRGRQRPRPVTGERSPLVWRRPASRRNPPAGPGRSAGSGVGFRSYRLGNAVMSPARAPALFLRRRRVGIAGVGVPCWPMHLHFVVQTFTMPGSPPFARRSPFEAPTEGRSARFPPWALPRFLPRSSRGAVRGSRRPCVHACPARGVHDEIFSVGPQLSAWHRRLAGRRGSGAAGRFR